MPHLRAFAIWVIVLFALWALVVGEWDRSIALFGVVAAVLAALFAEAARTRAGVGVRIPARLLARSATVPLAIVVDFGVLVRLLAQSALDRRVVRGVRVVRPLDADGPGARAWIALAATYSPNAIVLDVDAERGTVELHDLVPRRSSESPA